MLQHLRIALSAAENKIFQAYRERLEVSFHELVKLIEENYQLYTAFGPFDPASEHFLKDAYRLMSYAELYHRTLPPTEQEWLYGVDAKLLTDKAKTKAYAKDLADILGGKAWVPTSGLVGYALLTIPNDKLDEAIEYLHSEKLLIVKRHSFQAWKCKLSEAK